ncbi:nuclear transport factor 2 family protein [Nocardia sp. XZ_19_385]|uniref:nuclear transport factor 2 family protein n=1 Tax=Nocardia sp. XZ_19_385 TaxID=2769488 RepID=UPI00188E326F|nr:nuclear transport factor 2 family protein [Nocardia sp. XZ_19_385]
MSYEKLINTYCAAWSESDPERRRALLSQVWAEDATYTDPTVHAVGLDSLLDHIAAVLTRRPGATVQRTSAIDTHHTVARFAWHVVLADGSALPEGLDLVEFSEDGRIRRIVGFFGELGPIRQA